MATESDSAIAARTKVLIEADRVIAARDAVIRDLRRELEEVTAQRDAARRNARSLRDEVDRIHRDLDRELLPIRPSQRAS